MYVVRKKAAQVVPGDSFVYASMHVDASKKRKRSYVPTPDRWERIHVNDSSADESALITMGIVSSITEDKVTLFTHGKTIPLDRQTFNTFVNVYPDSEGTGIVIIKEILKSNGRST